MVYIPGCPIGWGEWHVRGCLAKHGGLSGGGPAEVVYCAGWDATTRRPVSPMSEATARVQDAAGAQYAVVVFVDGRARAVVEVCWSYHHTQVWHVDDDGRRYRGVAYRRWPDERLRLFEVRSWDYPDAETPEFAGDEPTFRARLHRDEHGAGGQIQAFVEMSNGSLQVVREWPDWPEPVRPEENVPVPALGDWPRLAGMTGPVTVRPGPDTVPDRFPWRPPRPLRPRYVTELVTEGSRFRTAIGAIVTIERIDAGTIRLPSGRLVVADPGWLHEDAVPLAETVPPGAYPVELFRQDQVQTVACRVRVADAPVASWHLGLLDGDHELTLGDGEFNGNPVDTATIALVDATGVPGYPRAEIERATMGGTAFRTVSDEKTGTDLVIVKGWTDGAYPVWLGRSAEGTIAAVVVDLMAPDLDDAEPV